MRKARALIALGALTAALGLGGAVAGRPIAIRFVDNRDQP